MKITLIKNLNNTFSIAYNSDFDKAKKLKAGREYQCDIKQPRNIAFHRKFFALVNLVFQNQEFYTNIDLMRKDLTIESGYFEQYKNFNGEVKHEAKSISFAKMKQEDFDTFYNRFLDTVLKIMNWDKQNVIDNVANFY